MRQCPLALAVLVGTALLFAGCTAQAQSTQPSREIDSLLIEANRLSASLDALPVWRSNRDLDENEWRTLLTCARDLQRTDPLVVQLAMRARAIAHQDDVRPHDLTYLSSSRFLLLNRVMFNVPPPPRRADGAAVTVSRGDSSFPILWNDGRPTLIARFDGVDGALILPDYEFRTFLGRYGYRNLDAAAGVPK